MLRASSEDRLAASSLLRALASPGDAHSGRTVDTQCPWVSCSQAGSSSQTPATSGDGARPGQRRELAVGKGAIQIRGVPGRACPVEFITELLQRHPLHRLHHGSDRAAQGWMAIAVDTVLARRSNSPPMGPSSVRSPSINRTAQSSECPTCGQHGRHIKAIEEFVLAYVVTASTDRACVATDST